MAILCWPAPGILEEAASCRLTNTRLSFIGQTSNQWKLALQSTRHWLVTWSSTEHLSWFVTYDITILQVAKHCRFNGLIWKDFSTRANQNLYDKMRQVQQQHLHMYAQREGPSWIFPPVVKESKHGHWCVSRLARTRIVVFLADRYCGVLRTRTVVFRCLQGHVLWWVSRLSRTRTVVGLVAFKDTYCGGSRGPQRHVLWCLIVDSRNVCSPCRFRLKLKRNFTVI